MIFKKIAAAVIVTVTTLSMVCSASACTALYVGSDLTEDGTAMFGRIEDLGTNDYNKLYYVSAAGKHKAGELYNGCYGFSYTFTHDSYSYTARRDDNALWYTISAPPALLRYVVEKGSITVDGISLTVATVGETSFSISAIPHTVRQTVLHHRRKGDLVNLETDIIGKYIEKLLQPAAPQPKESTITRDLLSRCGF